MTHAPHPFTVYTAEVLRFGFADGGRPPAPPRTASTESATAGCLRAVEREPKPRVLLLGLGSGTLVRALDAALPPDVELAVSELDPDLARTALSEQDAPWSRPGGRTVLLADSSPWAHFMLWNRHGYAPTTTHLRLNPESRSAGQDELRRLFAAAVPLAPAAPAEAPPLTVAAILALGDPGIDEFFAQIPAWAAEAVVVWDAAEPPAAPPPCAVPIRHLARPLGDDFAAQRNALLAACNTPWVLSLDADERLTPEAWEHIRTLAAAGGEDGPSAFYLPRYTLFPDHAHCLAGYGLWPDLQLRLFRRTPELRYERPVHERLTGVRGPFGVAGGVPITHLNRLLRDADGVRRKLAGFDRAGRGGVRHTLSEDYPRLPLAFFHMPPPAETAALAHACVLPFDPA